MQLDKVEIFSAKAATVNLPHSVEAEKAVLGAVLRDSSCIHVLEGILIPKHFFLDVHQKIFLTITNLSAKNESIDILTVAERLKEVEKEKLRTSPAYLVELTEACPLTQNIEHYARIVRTDFYRRQIIFECRNTIQTALNYEGSIESYIESMEKEFLKIANEYDRHGIVGARQVLDETIEDIELKLANADTVTGVTSGFIQLDRLTGGFQNSDLVIIAARPGMGKTAFALNCGTNAAKAGKRVVVFTLEMTNRQLMSRILSSESRVDSSRLRQGNLTEEEEDRLADGARKVYELSDCLAIDETPGISLMELRSRCRRFKKENGLDMVLIDYLQLMSASANRKMDSREREISEISMGLKSLAKELKIPVIALAQLNRGPDARPDKRPKMSDLRESGSMEQDADLIFFIYRDEYYNPSSEDVGIAELNVAKNRHGATTSIKLAFQPNFVSFQNLYLETSS